VERRGSVVVGVVVGVVVLLGKGLCVAVDLAASASRLGLVLGFAAVVVEVWKVDAVGLLGSGGLRLLDL
jgi:hypothetical protein